MRQSAPTRFRDHYAILGVSHDATEAEIKAAYRERAKQCHPDLHPGDAAAAERFQLISEARKVLLSPGSRAAFNLDRMEHELRVEIVSVVHFRRSRTASADGGFATAQAAPRAELARPVWQGASLIIAGLVAVLVSVTLLPLVVIRAGASSVNVGGFDSGSLGGMLNGGAALLLAVLAVASLRGAPGHRRWEALVGFSSLWLVCATGAEFDPHVLVGGFFASDLGLAIGGRILPVAIALTVCGAWLLRPARTQRG